MGESEPRLQNECELSITRWFKQLKMGDHLAEEALWQHYFPRLTLLARKKFAADRDAVYGADDAACSVMHLLYNGARLGRYDQVGGRDDLWRLLVAATRRKVIDQVRRRNSQKRGGGQTELLSDGVIQSPEPSPEMLAICEERLQELLGLLREDSLRKIALLRMEGHSNAEIATMLDVSERTIERKLNLIRGDWEKEVM